MPVSFEVDGLTVQGDHWVPANPAASASSPLVLLHGGGQTRHSWDRTASKLAARGREVYSFDARGHGDSQWSATGDYALETFSADLAALLRQLPGAPVLVGASLGGITSLYAIGELGVDASALVLVDVVVRLEPHGIGRIKEFMTAHTDGFDSLDEVADAIAAYNPARSRPRNLDGVRKNVRQRDDGRWYWHWDPVFISSGEEPRRLTDADPLAAAARQIVVPTLVVRGGKSDVVSDAGVADMLRLVPHAQIADVSDAGHMVAGDDNEVFSAAIFDFLEQHAL